MVRKIIQIDENKCNGCRLCVSACHEGAIGMVNGKAKLLRDDYCDGLGDCLPNCPTGAITFTEREAAPYDAAAVLENQRRQQTADNRDPKENEEKPEEKMPAEQASCLRQWPVQIRLAPVRAPYFDGADLLIAADCTAFSYGSFHQDFMKDRITLVGCPKLDAEDYSVKLTEILRSNAIRSVTIVRMQVPCCGGIEQAAVKALQNSEKFLPWQVVVISTDGKIVRQNRN